MSSSHAGRPLAVVSASRYFEDYARECTDWLRRYGWPVELHDSLLTCGHCAGAVVIGVHLHRHPPYNRRQFRVGVQTEQLPVRETSDARLLRNQQKLKSVRHYYDLMIEWSSELYASHTWSHPPVRHLHHGCNIQPASFSEPEFDLVFIGNPTGSGDRRADLLRELRSRYRMFPDHFGWGDVKLDAIRRSAICLNIHYYPDRTFEAPRMFELLSAGAFVISEEIADSYPFVAGRDYVSYRTKEDLTSAIDHYLHAPNERALIAASGMQTASHFTYERAFGELALELRRIAVMRRRVMARRISWLVGRITSGRIDAIDALAQHKRGIGAFFNRKM